MIQNGLVLEFWHYVFDSTQRLRQILTLTRFSWILDYIEKDILTAAWPPVCFEHRAVMAFQSPTWDTAWHFAAFMNAYVFCSGTSLHSASRTPRSMSLWTLLRALCPASGPTGKRLDYTDGVLHFTASALAGGRSGSFPCSQPPFLAHHTLCCAPRYNPSRTSGHRHLPEQLPDLCQTLPPGPGAPRRPDFVGLGLLSVPCFVFTLVAWYGGNVRL